jgi:hypothetical protein
VGFVQIYRHGCHTVARSSHGAYCGIDGAEPLHRYKPGGYHPIHLGDSLKSGRYQILHKLGWEGMPLFGLPKIAGQSCSAFG